MAIELIDLGTIAQDGADGDLAREAFIKCNDNFDYLDTNKVDTTDSRLSDAREWTATTVSQVEAETGTSTTRRAWTAERVFQAIAAWWAASSFKAKLDGIASGATANQTDAYLLARANHTGTQAISTVAGLQDELDSKQILLIPGTNITIDNTDPSSPVISADGGGSVGTVAGVEPDMSADIPAAELITALGIDDKVDKVAGKGLSTEDYTTTEKSKLAGIESGAQVNVATNISQGTRTSTTVVVESSTGSGATLSSATITEAGLQSAADKTKLEGIAVGATANPDTDSLEEGEDNLYFTEVRVRSTPLTGFIASPNEDVAATDSMVAAIGKLQAQIDAASGGGSDNDPLLWPRWAPSRANVAAGFGVSDGQLLSRATYPDAWGAIATGTVPVVDDATWLANPLQRGKFSTGDGYTTFRLPDYNGKFAGSRGAVFLRGDGALSAGTAGLIQTDQLGPMKYVDNAVNALTNIYISNGVSGLGATLPRNGPGTIQTAPVDAAPDGTKWITNTGNETRPLNVTGCWVIKLFGAVVNVGSADAAQLASDFANLAGALQALDSQIGFTIIYPNGGSAGSPVNVATNSRYVESNPFPGYFVLCEAELLDSGVWVSTGWVYNSASNISFGTRASQLNGGSIVIQTGSGNTFVGAASIGGAAVTISAPVACRVKVWKVKGAVA